MDISKREKIILGGMGAAIVAAAVYLLWPAAEPPSAEMTPQKLEESRKSAEAQLQALERVKLSAREMHAVNNSQEPWPRDPLAPKPPEPDAPVEKEKFEYTGFIRIGNNRLAVINGREYQVGEQLEAGGFEVVEITPSEVVLLGLARKNQVRIPYQDPSFFTGR